jgi:hypothetical protein
MITFSSDFGISYLFCSKLFVYEDSLRNTGIFNVEKEWYGTENWGNKCTFQVLYKRKFVFVA